MSEKKYNFDFELDEKKKKKIDGQNSWLGRLPGAEVAQKLSTSHHKRSGLKAAASLVLAGSTFGVTNAMQDDIIKYLTNTSQALNIDGLTGEQIAQKTQSNFDILKKTNSQIAKASDSINGAINIFNQDLLPQIKITTQNSDQLVKNAKDSIIHFQTQIDQTSAQLSKIDAMLQSLEKKQKDAPITQSEIDGMQTDLKDFNISGAAGKVGKSISEWFTGNAINLTVGDTISKLQEMRNGLLEAQKKYTESKNYFEKTVGDFDKMGKNLKTISGHMASQVNNINTKNLTISDASGHISTAAENAELYYSQSQISNILAKEKIDDLIKKLNYYFQIMNIFSVLVAVYSSILLVGHHRNNLIDQKKAMSAIIVALIGFGTPSALENKAVSMQVQKAEKGDYGDIAKEIVETSNNLSDVFQKTLIKLFGGENIVK